MIRIARNRTIAALALAGALAGTALGLTGCSSGPAPASSTGNSTSSRALPPVIADLGSIDGTTVRVPMGGTVDLTGADKDFTHWTADIADAKVVSFMPGKDDGSAQFNPGLDALATGTTAVTLDNSASGAHVSFTVEVTPKK